MHHGMPVGGKFGPHGSTAVDSNQIYLAFAVRNMGCWHRTPKIYSKYVCTLVNSHLFCPSSQFTIAIPGTQPCVSLHSTNLDPGDPLSDTNWRLLRVGSAPLRPLLWYARHPKPRAY